MEPEGADLAFFELAVIATKLGDGTCVDNAEGLVGPVEASLSVFGEVHRILERERFHRLECQNASA